MRLLAWFARNRVAANVVALVLVVGGLLTSRRVKQEVFPDVELDLVIVSLAYPGATPEEVEQGVVLATEEAVRGIDGVKTVSSVSAEGAALVVVELEVGTDADRVLADVKSAVDRVTSYPAEAEEPVVFLPTTRRRVVSVVISGDVEESVLRGLAERTRDELLADPRVSQVELAGLPPPEISIEVPRAELRRYGLTLPEIADRVRAASVEIAGGELETPGGEVLVRTAARRLRGEDFRDVAVVSTPTGSRVRLSELATIRDVSRDTDQITTFDGRRAVLVEVFRVGDETPKLVSAAAEEATERLQAALPPGISATTWFDQSEIFEQRVQLLTKNGALGLILVLLLLGLFLEPRLAAWVAFGIVVAFVGTFLFFPMLDASINLISLFAFVVVLGVVVDDAIIVGEAIFRRRSQGLAREEAAIRGLGDVVVPVVFAVSTTMIAFSPMLFIPGFGGKLFRNIPIVVITVLALSLVEALFVLPAHLGHGRERRRRGPVLRAQQRVSRGLERLVDRVYTPLLARATAHRVVTIAAFVAILLLAAGLVVGGRMDLIFLPRIESDVVTARLELPVGTNERETRAATERLVASAGRALADLGGGVRVDRGILATVGGVAETSRDVDPVETETGGHIAEVAVLLRPVDERPFSAQALAARWRAETGEIPGARSVRFAFEIGQTAEAPIAFRLAHADPVVLERAARELAAAMRDYPGVTDVDDGVSRGKPRLDLDLEASARDLGLTDADLARQVRGAFFGAEAVREQRGRDELRVYVRLPAGERDELEDARQLVVRTPAGGELLLADAARLRWTQAPSEIRRDEGRRIAEVTADVDVAVAAPGRIAEQVRRAELAALLATYEGLTYTVAGEQQEEQEILSSLISRLLLALLVIFAVLAIAFRSYLQPALVIVAVPFGAVGAIAGHLLMGYDLSLMSILGIVALSGVVVNDSLILIVAVNELRAKGRALGDALREGAAKRFRPILLTSLTTFFGLSPLILETSVQARFLIPMAISLGFGVLFGSLVTLLLVPSMYLVLEGARGLLLRKKGSSMEPHTETSKRQDPRYGHTIRLRGVSHEAARKRAIEALAREGFGVLTEIDVRATLADKLGVPFHRYVILGACHPGLAHRALEVEPGVGLLLPCNVCVWEEDDSIVVSALEPREMLRLAENPALEPIAAEADARLRRAIDSLR